MYLHPPCLVSGISACWPGILAICYHLAHFPSPLKNQFCLIPGCVHPSKLNGASLSHRHATCYLQNVLHAQLAQRGRRTKIFYSATNVYFGKPSYIVTCTIIHITLSNPYLRIMYYDLTAECCSASWQERAVQTHLPPGAFLCGFCLFSQTPHSFCLLPATVQHECWINEGFYKLTLLLNCSRW